MHAMSCWDLYRELSPRQASLVEGLDSDDHLLHLEGDFSFLWQRVQGLPLSCDGAVLEIAICCSLLQLQLCLALRDNSPSHSDHAHLHLRQLMHRLRVNFNIGGDCSEDECFLPASLLHHPLLNDYMRHAIARVFTVVSVTELLSASLHEGASKRLAVAHELLSSCEHSSCRDWFECLLRSKASLCGECSSEGELNYFNDWWSQDVLCSASVSLPSSAHWSSSLQHFCSGNSLAQRGCLHLAVGRYRQCLLQRPGFSLCTAPAISNTALLFQRMNNMDAELEARTLLLKALHHLAPDWSGGSGSRSIIWRKDCHVSAECGICDNRTWWPRAVYATALRAVHCKRPKLAVSVLKEEVDMTSLYGLVPRLLQLHSLIELGRGSEALDICLRGISGWKGLDYLRKPQTGVQMAQILLLASIAAVSCDQYELAHLLAVRCTGLSVYVCSQLAEAPLLQRCTQCMQLSLCVRAVLLVGAGHLTSALSLLMHAVSGSCENVIIRYNLALLKVKLAYDSSTLTPQTLTAFQRCLKDTLIHA